MAIKNRPTNYTHKIAPNAILTSWKRQISLFKPYYGSSYIPLEVAPRHFPTYFGVIIAIPPKISYPQPQMGVFGDLDGSLSIALGFHRISSRKNGQKRGKMPREPTNFFGIFGPPPPRLSLIYNVYLRNFQRHTTHFVLQPSFFCFE